MHKYLVLLAVHVVLVSSATWYKKNQPNNGPQPGCYIKEVDRVIPFGQEVTTDDCVRVECTVRYIYYSSCSVYPECESLPGIKTAEYPECCPIPSCDDVENNRI